jgi:hypothetical protein
MKTAVVMLLSMAGLSCAQDKKADNNRPETKQSERAGDKKRLQSVTWDLNSHKLVWVIQHGVEENGQFVAKGSDRYEISPDEATMKFANEQRGFTREEATSLHKLLDTLSLYCAESVIWWDQGQGEPVDGAGRGGKGNRVDEQPRKEESKPAKKVLVAFEK